jgi:hypothetical protein
MRKTLILFTFLFFFVHNLNADILDIPEVKVYGERKVEVEPIKKQSLPFEKEYLEPEMTNTKKELPHFEVLSKKITERNIGCRAKAIGGTYFEGYFLGYSRKIFYPLEVGLDFTKNSTAESSAIQIFSRTSVESFYANAALHGIESFDPVYRFSIGNTHKIIDIDFFGVYSDSLIGIADITFKYSPFKLNLQLGEPVDYSVKVQYEKYPLQAGAVWYDEKIYPELVYFLPFYDLYLKGSLLNKTGLAYLFCQSSQYLREYASNDAYYRIELGQATNNLPLSLIYSHYLKNSSNFVGIKASHSKLFIEFEYPLESDYDYILRAGLSTNFTDLISANVYGYTNGTERYFIGADLGYNLRYNIRVGIEGDYIYGLASEDDFDIGGYLFFAF